MLLHNTGDSNRYSDVVNARSNNDYIKNGKIFKNSAMQMVLVSGTQDLNLLSEYAPGTIAYTAGFETMWQKSASGQWVQI